MRERSLRPGLLDRPNPALREDATRTPLDPRAVLTSIGAVVYDWDLATDRMTWGLNARDVLGLADPSSWDTGHGFSARIEASNERSRRDTILSDPGADGGSGVAYRLQFTLRNSRGEPLDIEDAGRWFADTKGRPAVAHGLLRVRPGASADVAPVSLGARERADFLRQIATDVVEASSQRRPLTVVVAALDGLSLLNEAIGFEAADQAIEAVMARIKSAMRRRDRIVRYSGNRFALALRACAADRVVSAIERIEAKMATGPIPTAGGPVDARLAFGAAVAPDHATDAASLLQRAEQSLGLAKRSHGSKIVVYAPARSRPDIQTGGPTSLDVVNLINARRIGFAKQPVVETHSRRVGFSEALLRVRQEDGRLITAADIVPEIERSGLVPLVDVRILELAAEHLAANPEERLSINVSPLTLDSPDWLSTLSAHLGARPGIAPRLILEITETAAVRDAATIRNRLEAMKALGVSVAIDDFGAGHTSFRHLRDFPIDIVKIDGAFVQNLTRSNDDRFFVQTLIDLAHHLGVAIVAEWVEDEDTARLLAKWGVDYLQGDHCGRPVMVEQSAPGVAAPWSLLADIA